MNLLLGLNVASQQANGILVSGLSVLKQFGADAHAYIAGVGTINGLTAGNYLDSAGTTAASYDGLCGRMNDAAQGLGAELYADASFNNPSAWSLVQPTSGSVAVSGGQLTITSNDGTSANAAANPSIIGSLVVGKTYQYTVEVSAVSGLGGYIYFSVGNFTPNFTTTGTKTGFITITLASNPSISHVAGGASSITIDSISLKEVIGIHATQATDANKPTLRKGAVNLLTWSEDFSNASWIKFGAPTVTNKSFTRTTTAASYVQKNTIKASATATQYTLQVKAKKTLGDYLAVRVQGFYPARTDVVFNISNGTIATAAVDSSGFISSPPNITDLGGGYYLFTLTATTDANGTVSVILSCNSNNVKVDGVDSVSDSSCLVEYSMLETGSTASPYVATTTASASNGVGSSYAQFDGVDDYLLTTGSFWGIADNFVSIDCVSYAAITGATQYASNPATTAVGGNRAIGALGIYTTGAPIGLWLDDAVTSYFIGVGGAVITPNVPLVQSCRQTGNLKEVQSSLSPTVYSSSAVLAATTCTQGAIGALNSVNGRNGGKKLYCSIKIKGTVSDADWLTLRRFAGLFGGVSL